MEYSLIINPNAVDRKNKNYELGNIERYKAILIWKGSNQKKYGLSKGYPESMTVEEILQHASDEVKAYTGSRKFKIIVNPN